MSFDRTIVVPGRGVVNLDAEKVNRAVKEYDENLRFGFNEVQGDWVVYVRMPRNFEAAYYIEGEPVYPVLGIGSEVLSPDVVLRRLYEADTARHGLEKLDRMNAENERLKKLSREAEDAATEETAERIEHELRTQGETDKYTKVFMPGD